MDLYDVMRTTAAVREFTDDPLPDDVLHTILDNARFAPSGGNRQGAEVIVVTGRAGREAIVAATVPGARRYVAQILAGEGPWNSIDPTSLSAEQIAATEVPERFTAPVLTAPVVLVFCVDLRKVASTDQDLDRVGVISGASVYPLVWNVLLAARHEGFGGTITTMAVAEEDSLKAALGVPDSYAVAAVVPLGKPVKQLTKLKRVEVADFVRRESFAGESFLGSVDG